MALYHLATFPISTVIKLTFPRRSSLGLSRNGQVRCMVATESCDKSIARRSGNYPTPFLDHEFLQSLTSGYVGEAYTGQANKLKETVRNMLENPLTALGQLELIDCLQRLGLAYQFEQEIKSILESRWNDYQKDNREMKEDLYATSVEFRLLRQHGYNNEAEKEPTESEKAPAEPEKLETSESSEKPTELAVAKEEPSTAVKEQAVEKPEEPVKQEKVVAEAPEKLETSKSTNKPSEPAVVKEEPLTVKEQSAEKSEETIKQEKAVTEEPVVVPGQETLNSEIPAEPVPVSGTVNAPVKVDTEKVTGEVTPGETAENTKITETAEEKKPEEVK